MITEDNEEKMHKALEAFNSQFKTTEKLIG
jgi:hypothetical protein